MRKLGSEFWGLVGHVVDVIRRGVELDSDEHSKGSYLGETSRSAQPEDVKDGMGYLCGSNGLF